MARETDAEATTKEEPAAAAASKTKTPRASGRALKKVDKALAAVEDAKREAALDAADEKLIASLDATKYDIPEIRKKLRELRLRAPEDAKKKRGASASQLTNLMMIGVMVVMLVSMIFAGPEGLAKPEVAVLEQTLFKTVISRVGKVGLQCHFNLWV